MRTATTRFSSRLSLSRVRVLLEPPGDLSLPENRARDRQRRAGMAALMSMAAKLTSVATQLITVPLTLHYLGAERYGMWMIISSLVAMLSFADLGIGNGILNIVAAAYGRNDAAAMRRGISSGLAVLSVVAVAIVATFAIIYPYVSWYRVFNVSTPHARAEAGPAIATFIVCFALAIPAGVVQRVQMGLQRGFLANLWQCGGSLLALAAVLVAIAAQASLPWLVAAFLSGPLLVNLLNSVVFFGWLRPDLRPAAALANRDTAGEVMRTGILFLLLQVAAAVTYSSDNIIIAQLLGPSSVPLYAVPERLFSVITITATMALSPLWPAYRESIVRGDVDWTRRTLVKSIKVATGYAATLSIPLVLLSPWIIHLWVRDAVQPPFALIAGLGLWKIVEASGLALAMFLNGAHVVKTQAIVASATAIVSITLEFILIRQIGVAGAVWATLIAFTMCALIPYSILAPRIIRQLGRAA